MRLSTTWRAVRQRFAHLRSLSFEIPPKVSVDLDLFQIDPTDIAEQVRKIKKIKRKTEKQRKTKKEKKREREKRSNEKSDVES